MYLLSKPIVKIAATALACAALNGCEVLEMLKPIPCDNVDWEFRGYRSAMEGNSSSELRREGSGCVEGDINHYALMRGWKKGAAEYCTPENAYKIGVQGKGMTTICSEAGESQQVFDTYCIRGANVKNVHDQLAWIDAQIADIQDLASYEQFESLKFLDGLTARINDIRKNLADYAADVEKRAYNEDIKVIDFRQQVTSLPDWKKYKEFDRVLDMFLSADNLRQDKEEAIDGDKSCIKANKGKKGDKELLKQCKDDLKKHERELDDLYDWYEKAIKDIKQEKIPSKCPGC